MSGSERPGTAPAQAGMNLMQALALAEQHRANGNLTAAESLCRQIIQAAPRNADALHLLGIVLHQGGNADAGIDFIKQAIGVSGHSPLYHTNLGEMCRLAGRLDEAVAAGLRALELQPNHAQAANNLAIAYYDRKEYEQAETYYRKALQIDPNFAEAHSNLGNALRAQKKYDEAIACYDRALALRPNYVEAYNNKGTALREAERKEESEAAYRKALALRPADPATLNNLALVLLDLKRKEEARSMLTRSVALDPRNPRSYVYLATALRELELDEEAKVAASRAVALAPQDPDALNILGRSLLDDNRTIEAIDHFRRAIALKPDMADAFNNMANALKEMGQMDEAMDAYRNALEFEPKSTSVFLNLVDAKTFASADDPHLKTLEEIAGETDTLKTDDVMQLHFSLGKVYADLKRYDESFEHMFRGNALKRKQIEYDEGPTLGIFDRVRNIFTPELVRAKTGIGHPTDVPIFILGMPRSGSTLIEQILASHPRVFGAGELKDFDTVVKSVRGGDGSYAPYPEFVPGFEAIHCQRMAQQYLRRLRSYSAGADRITNKMPSSFFYVGLIHIVMPNARIIHTTRNPVDTCLSCFSKLFAGIQAFTYDLGELGRYYRKYDELMAHWRAVLPPGAILDVQYEDVVADLETNARRIVEYCGLEWDDACLAFHEHKRPIRTASATQVRKPIYKSSVGRWLPYKAQLEPLLRELPPETPA